jgi:hypothetical protein
MGLQLMALLTQTVMASTTVPMATIPALTAAIPRI